MAGGFLTLPVRTRDQLFPFRLVLSRTMEVLESGEVLRRIAPVLAPGSDAAKWIRQWRPAAALNYETLLKQIESLVLLEVQEPRLVLRGQLLSPGAEGALVYLGTPWLSSTDEMVKLGLRLNDFALHDPTSDVLQLLQTQQSSVNDLQQLNQLLEAQQAALRKANQQLRRQNLDQFEVERRLLAERQEARRMALVAQRASSPVLLADRDGCIEWVNDAFVKLTGYSAEEARGKKRTQFLRGPRTDPAAVEEMERKWSAVEPHQAELVNYNRAGEAIWMRLDTQPVFDEAGEHTGYIALELDVTEQKAAERRARLEFELGLILAEESDARRSARRVMETIARHLSCAGATFWRVDAGREELQPWEIWTDGSLELERFAEHTTSQRFAEGIGLPGTVWQSGVPVWWESIGSKPQFLRRDLAKECGLEGAFAFPIRSAGAVRGVMDFYLTRNDRPEERMLELLMNFGSPLGQALERAESEERRQELLSMLTATLESTGDGILVADEERQFVRVNRRFEELWGLPVGGAASLTTEEVVLLAAGQLERPGAFLEMIERYRENPGGKGEETLVLSNGRVFTVYTQPRWQDGKIAGRVWSYRDVTRQWRSEQELRAREESYRVLAQTASDGILTVDEENLVTYANPAAAKILGYAQAGGAEREPLAGRRLGALLDEELESEVCPLGSFETQGIRKSGRRIALEMSIGHSQLGERRMRTLVFRDISERKLTEARLREAKEAAEENSRAKSEFLANMSHELRTPLNAILGYSEMLAEDAGAAGQREVVQDLQRIRSAGLHLLDLINNVLDMARIEAGRLVIKRQWVESGPLVEECLALVKPLADQYGNRLYLDAPSPLPPALLDPMRFRQCLFNLLSNAAKFTENGEIRLRCQVMERGDGLVFRWTVEDNGPGIAPEDLQRLFRAFEQVDGRHQRKRGGTGLGLAITRQIWEAMGGRVEVESEPGRGSRFSLVLDSATVGDGVLQKG